MQYESLKAFNIEKIITEEEHQTLIEFRNHYRTSELHKYSSVRAFLSKDKWNHFQKEECVLRDIILRFNMI